MLIRVLAILLLVTPCVFSHDHKPLVPCYFIFGDSLSDAGSNNGLKTAAVANYEPYGVDFPGGATGRFTNGRTIVDLLAKLLGFRDYIPPYSKAKGPEVLKGVNYASGAAGIRRETSSHLGDRIWMDRQLLAHANTIKKLKSFIHKALVTKYLSKCLYTINIGSNDYINNYFMPQHYHTHKLFTPEIFATLLVDQYSHQLKALYASGARKMAVFGLGDIGCTPAEIVMHNATQCITEINDAVRLFNQKLALVLDHLNFILPGAKFAFVDIAAMQTASPLGGFITNSTCCKLRSDYQCEPFVQPCQNSDFYAFMDGFHPTEAVNELTAANVFNAPDPKFVRPMDISHLVSN